MQLTPAQTLSVNTTRTDGLQTETSTLLILTYVSRSPVACDLICRCLFTEMMLTVTGGGHIYPHSISERAGLVGVIVASSSQFVIVLSTSLIPSPANPIDFITVAAATTLSPPPSPLASWLPVFNCRPAGTDMSLVQSVYVRWWWWSATFRCLSLIPFLFFSWVYCPSPEHQCMHVCRFVGPANYSSLIGFIWMRSLPPLPAIGAYTVQCRLVHFFMIIISPHPLPTAPSGNEQSCSVNWFLPHTELQHNQELYKQLSTLLLRNDALCCYLLLLYVAYLSILSIWTKKTTKELKFHVWLTNIHSAGWRIWRIVALEASSP